MTKIKEVDPEIMKLNPFVQSFRIPVTRVTDKRYSTKHTRVEHVVYDMETTQCVKIFYTPDEGAIPGTLKTLAALTQGGKNLFIYVLAHLEMGQDWIRINRSFFMKHYNVSSINTVKKAEKELCRACLLNRCEDYKDVFWINPKFFFSGSRVKNFPDNCDIKPVTNK